MKVILSRKGFDGSNGGIPSPIWYDGTLTPLPIPSSDSSTYDDIAVFQDGSCLFSDLLNDLRPGIARHHCHIDPDLQQRYITPPINWKPAFGQCGASKRVQISCIYSFNADKV